MITLTLINWVFAGLFAVTVLPMVLLFVLVAPLAAAFIVPLIGSIGSVVGQFFVLAAGVVVIGGAALALFGGYALLDHFELVEPIVNWINGLLETLFGWLGK